MEVLTLKDYPRNYNEVVDVAKNELKEGRRPKLKTKVENIDSYDVIILEYSNW